MLEKNDSLKDVVIAIPGEYTMAHLLLKLWFPGLQTVPVRFDAIMPGVRKGMKAVTILEEMARCRGILP